MKNEWRRWNKQMITTFNEYRMSNILNKDGTINYYGKILSSEEANQYFDLLMQNIHGKKMKSSFLANILLLKEIWLRLDCNTKRSMHYLTAN
jgi:hypothetical protein